MIESPKSAAVRRVAALRDKKHRSETGLALLEGPQVVREVLQHGPDLVEDLYLTSDAMSRNEDLLDAARAAGIEIELASEAALAAMADTRTPQGVVAVARQAPVTLTEAFEGATLVAILDEVRDPGNAGTIIRAADAAGADAVVLTGSSVDAYNPKVVRATTGSIFHLRIATGSALAAAVVAAHAAGLDVVAADMHGEPITAVADAIAGPVAWLFGNEAHGISAEAATLADRTIAVPIYGAAESLNLGTAAAVCLYASAFARRR